MAAASLRPTNTDTRNAGLTVCVCCGFLLSSGVGDYINAKARKSSQGPTARGGCRLHRSPFGSQPKLIPCGMHDNKVDALRGRGFVNTDGRCGFIGCRDGVKRRPEDSSVSPVRTAGDISLAILRSCNESVSSGETQLKLSKHCGSSCSCLELVGLWLGATSRALTALCCLKSAHCSPSLSRSLSVIPTNKSRATRTHTKTD
jgi:hypothetical protein